MRQNFWLAFAVALTSTILAPGCVQEPDRRVCSPGDTQRCVCSNGNDGTQSCAYNGERWNACQCSSTRPPATSPDAGTSTGGSCITSGRLNVACGCWGYAYEGQTFSQNRCCSGVGVAVRCTGWCADGSSSWAIACY